MILGTILRLEARTCVRFGIGTQRIGSSAARTQWTWSTPTAVRFSTCTLLQPLSKRPSIPPLRSLRLARSTSSAPPPPPRRPEPILEPYDDLPPSPGTSRLRLLLTPTLFTLLVLSGSYYYTTQHTYLAPRPSERIFPGLTVAEATVYSLIAANAAVFLLWKVPHPANWRLLNKYFVNSASAPTALSMLGSTFSHQSFLHLAINCFALAGFGVDVCEQVGRGNFLALYASAGVLSSWCSLGWSVLGKRFVTHALGASGAILGLVGAFINFHPNAQIALIFLPWYPISAENAGMMLAAFEMTGIAMGWKRLDHMAHLSGMVFGYCAAAWWRERERQKRRSKERWAWWT